MLKRVLVHLSSFLTKFVNHSVVLLLYHSVSNPNSVWPSSFSCVFQPCHFWRTHGRCCFQWWACCWYTFCPWSSASTSPHICATSMHTVSSQASSHASCSPLPQLTYCDTSHMFFSWFCWPFCIQISCWVTSPCIWILSCFIFSKNDRYLDC